MSPRTPYGSSWRKLRQAHLSAEPFCVRCAEAGVVRPASEVDHIESIRAAPQRVLDASNLQSLCHPCHVTKTWEDEKGRVKGCDVRGLPRDPRHHWHG